MLIDFNQFHKLPYGSHFELKGVNLDVAQVPSSPSGEEETRPHCNHGGCLDIREMVMDVCVYIRVYVLCDECEMIR